MRAQLGKELRLTTTIIGGGNIGGALARHLVAGRESVVLAANDEARAEALADELGPRTRAAVAAAEVPV